MTCYHIKISGFVVVTASFFFLFFFFFLSFFLLLLLLLLLLNFCVLGSGFRTLDLDFVSDSSICITERGPDNKGGVITVKPVLNWANVCSPEHTSDTSTNYDLFLN